jgi:hypothetical protein
MLMTNKKYLEIMKESTGRTNIDCTKYSTVAASTALALLKKAGETNIPVKLVTGLYFDTITAPEGIGHQWAEINGQIVDLAIQVPTRQEAYIPITGVDINLDIKNNRMLLRPEVYCITPDLKELK